MLSAALLHASWHALVKSADHPISALAVAGVVSALAASCFLPLTQPLPAPAWLIIMISVPIHFGYKVSLAKAYEYGDLGEAYPLGRGLVPLFATGLAFLTLGQVPTTAQLLGIALVSLGLVGLAASRTRGTSIRFFAAAAGIGLTVSVYSVLDAYGIRISGTWLSFTVWLVLIDSAAFFLFAALTSSAFLWAELRRSNLRSVTAGLLGLCSFAVFLWAVSRSAVGPVTALRETSVVFAALIGIAVLGEEYSAKRLIPVFFILVGIIVIALTAEAASTAFLQEH